MEVVGFTNPSWGWGLSVQLKTDSVNIRKLSDRLRPLSFDSSWYLSELWGGVQG